MAWTSGVGTDLTCNPIQVGGTRTSDVQSGSPTDRVPVQKTQTPVDKTRYNKDLDSPTLSNWTVSGQHLDAVWTASWESLGSVVNTY